MKIDVFERGFSPTPIQELTGVCPKNRVFLKREDFLPFSFGGNKVRKARHFYREIQTQSADVVMTYGSSSSNHCRIIANMAAAMGLPCHIISPEENYKDTPNSRMVERFGAVVEKVPLSGISQAIEARRAAYQKSGKNPYFIQGGGHGDPGTAAYVECYEEIRRWEQEREISFDYIFHVSGTGTTQAGLVCGLLACGRQAHTRIVGLSNARTLERGRPVVVQSALSWLEHVYALQMGRRILEDTVEQAVCFEDAWRLGGYGCYNSAVLGTVDEMMKRYGIPMDTTYVGKGFWAMTEYVKREGLTGKKILFLHTGGTPLFFEERPGEENAE